LKALGVSQYILRRSVHGSSEIANRITDECLRRSGSAKVGLPSEKYEWLACELKTRGEKQGLAFLRKRRKSVVMRKGQTLGARLTATGEFSAFIHGHAAEFHGIAAKALQHF
jgi:hypothetical protein